MKSLIAGMGLAVAAGTARAPAPIPPARAYYAAPTGSPSGDGTLRGPWDLGTALGGGAGAIRVQPGDTIWLRGGTYRGAFRSMLRGTDGAPIVVRQYPGERAIIDGAGSTASTLHVDGDYSVFWGFELTNSDSVRTATTVSHEARPAGVVNSASHTKYINLVVHDAGSAFYTEPKFVDVEIAGCLIYDNGWDGPDRGHGHGMYLKSLTGPLIARENVVFNQFGYGVHVYTNAGTGKLVNIRIEGNVAFNNGTLSMDRASPNILLGGADYATGDVVRENLTYFSPGLSGANVRIGYKTLLNGDAQVERNYFVGGSPVLEFGYWTATKVMANTFVGTGTLVQRNQPGVAGQVWVDNVEDRRPRVTKVVVRPNPYEPGRAHIVVFNWAGDTAIDADLTGILAAGDRYEVRNVQDFFGAPVAQGTSSGRAIRIPMDGRPPPVPTGLRSSLAPRTGPEFDVFVVVRLPQTT